MSFSQLRKNSKSGFSDLAEKMKASEKGGSGGKDERLWEPTVDATGNGSAVIRFLPATDGEEVPYAKRYSHGFKVGAKWYIENCPTTLGKGTPCPVCESNNELWATEIKENQDLVRSRKRQLSYYANIYVVRDPKNPDNEGKVFLFRFGKKIFDKLMDSMSPEFDDQEAINPFDLWSGANFNLRICKVEGYRNYDKSSFSTPSRLLPTDEELEAVWNKQYKLLDLVDPKEFKSAEELQKSFDRVLGKTGGTTSVERAEAETNEFEEAYQSVSQPARSTAKASTASDEVDPDLAAYAALLDD